MASGKAARSALNETAPVSQVHEQILQQTPQVYGFEPHVGRALTDFRGELDLLNDRLNVTDRTADLVGTQLIGLVERPPQQKGLAVDRCQRRADLVRQHIDEATTGFGTGRLLLEIGSHQRLRILPGCHKYRDNPLRDDRDPTIGEKHDAHSLGRRIDEGAEDREQRRDRRGDISGSVKAEDR